MARIKIFDKAAQKWVYADNSYGIKGKSAYEYAKEGGYTGTESDFEKDMAREVPEVVQEMGKSEKLVMSQAAVTNAFKAVTTLPYGGSREWLENNGDKNQLYQIDGYVWGYIQSEGWTKGGTQYIIVSNENEMTNNGGTNYLLRSGDQGTVYNYTESSGDVGIPVYSEFPTTANEGDIIAIGDRKYKAKTETKEVPNYTNLAKNIKKGYRISASAGTAAMEGAAAVEDYIGPLTASSVVRVKGFGALNFCQSCTYNADKAAISASVPGTNWVGSDYSYKSATETAEFSSFGANVIYLRVSGKDTGSEIIVTLDEEITTRVETVITWTDVGEYVEPTEGGWKPTDLIYPILDSLPEEMDTGMTVVYSADGYTWTYLKVNDWVKTETSFSIVSSTDEMTKQGGIDYLLRNEDSGIVYTYNKPTGDVDVPVYDSLPETANDGDIIAVGSRKYKATFTSKEVLAYTNLADPTSSDWVANGRLNSSGGVSTEEGIDVTNFIGPIHENDVIRIQGMDMTSNNSYPVKADKATTGMGITKLTAWLDGATGQEVTKEGGTATATGAEFTVGSYDQQQNGYWRFSGKLNTTANDVIITINEEITTKIELTLHWVDIGEYIVPTQATWEPTNKTYRVVDSLLEAPSNSEQVVYSLDGFLYLYYSGDSWMLMSKYETPTLIADDILSTISTNAVQNKIVTAEINNIKQRVEKHQDDILTLQNKVNEGINSSGSNEITIPSYWESSISTKTSTVKELQTAGGKNCISFVWASDTHIPDNHNTRTDDLGKLMAKMMDNCEIPFALITGDINTRASYAEKSGLLNCIAQIPEHLAPLWGTDRLLLALGNHDGSWGDSSGYYRKQLPPEEMWQIFFRGQALDFRRVFSEDGLYFYVDNIPQKVRFIVLNSHFAGEYAVDENGWAVNNRMGTSCYGQEQLEWLANVALDMPEGYGAILSAHISDSVDQSQLIGIVNAFNNKTTFNGSYTAGVEGWSNSNIGVNFTKANGEIIAMFAGHIHWDKIDTTTMACPIIRILSAGAPENTNKMEEGEVAPIRTKGTDTETSFDVVTINRATRTIYCTRLGGGDDRSVQY